MAKHSLASHEGYMLHDETASGGARVEMKTFRCNHCGGVVQMHPLRTREREYCPKCDHKICDGCGLTRKMNGGECTPIQRVVDEIMTASARAVVL